MAKKKSVADAIAMQMEEEELEINQAAHEEETKGKKKTFSVSLNEDFLEELREEAKKSQITVNALICLYLSDSHERRKRARLNGFIN